MIFKKKKGRKVGQMYIGMDVKHCKDCKGPTRLCLVDDRHAIFHRWVDEDKALLRINAFMSPNEQEKVYRRFRSEGILENFCSTEKLHQVLALIEYADDGTVDTVPVQKIRFIHPREA